MATDFTYGNKTITTSGPTKPATKNSPGDVRTRVQTYADISTIPMPYIGMPIVVLEDETNENKMTEYRVKSLKANTLGVQDTVVNEVVRLKDFLEIPNSSSGAGLTDEEKQNLSEIPQLKNTVEKHTEIIKTLQDNSSDSIINSEWSGKIASFLGDSITYGANTAKIYHQYLKELVGFSVCNNYGVDGSSITNHSNGICTRYNSVASNSDIIFIFGGTNDFYYNKPLGEWYTLSGTTRTLNNNMSTFRGALAVICDGLITKFPTKQIVLMTPIHRFTFGSQQTDLQANANGLYLDDYVECVKEAGKIFGIPVIDLNGESGLYPMNTENANAYFHTSDKLHPNADGHLKMARTIQGKLRTILPLDVNYIPNVYGDIVLSKTSITMDEGTSNTFTVKLDKAPTNSQVVALSVNNTDVTLSTNTLTFTSDNYNQAQEVRVNVTEDSDKLNDNCTITLSSSGVANKTVVLTINDITVDDTPPSDDGNLTGKSYKFTFNGSQGGYNHLVFVIPKDEDCVSGATLNMKFDINNVVNFPASCNVTMIQVFNSSTPEVNNGVGTQGGSNLVNQATTFSNGSASINFNFTLRNPNNNYLKIPYGLKPNGSPASVDISNIAVTVNGKPKPIVTVGAFFASENCVVSEL